MPATFLINAILSQKYYAVSYNLPLTACFFFLFNRRNCDHIHNIYIYTHTHERSVHIDNARDTKTIAKSTLDKWQRVRERAARSMDMDMDTKRENAK